MAFFEQLLRDTHVRTHDPWRANLFYVPAFTLSYAGNGGAPHEYVRRVIRFLAAEYPALWARRGGRDHIFWAAGDRGACPLPPDLAQLIWLVHYGSTHPLPEDGTAGAAALPPTPTCFDAQRGVVTPPFVAQAAAIANATFGAADADSAERPTLFFFAGDIRPAEPHYSQGVRQKIYQLYHGRSAEGYSITEGRVGDMVGEMRRAQFCLAPAGHGWGIRIVHAMATGCVPVIIQDGVHQPFDDVLPYHEFALRLPQADIERLDAILRAVTPAELRLLQAGVRRYHRAFVWGEAGEAYAFTVKSLRRRLQALLAGF